MRDIGGRVWSEKTRAEDVVGFAEVYREVERAEVADHWQWSRRVYRGRRQSQV